MQNFPQNAPHVLQLADTDIFQDEQRLDSSWGGKAAWRFRNTCDTQPTQISTTTNRLKV